MKKFLVSALACLLAATAVTGCGRKTVSDDPGGRITDPTGPQEPIVTLPSMTTAPTGDRDPSLPPVQSPSVSPDHPKT